MQSSSGFVIGRGIVSWSCYVIWDSVSTVVRPTAPAGRRAAQRRHRYAPDAAWLSPEQLADRNTASARTGLLRFCPHFVAEVMSRNRPSFGGPAQDGRVHRQRRAAGLAH